MLSRTTLPSITAVAFLTSAYAKRLTDTSDENYQWLGYYGRGLKRQQPRVRNRRGLWRRPAGPPLASLRRYGSVIRAVTASRFQK
jgi:hypothetical protein